jgi:endonuclease YncB( thermonuclease family)
MQFEREYSKRAHIIRFRDGDTVVLFIKCEHCNGIHEEVMRIQNIDSWEPRGPDSEKAAMTAHTLTEKFRGVIGILIPNKLRKDKYGRIIGDLIIDGHLLSNLIVEAGHAWYGVGAVAPADQQQPILS